MSSLRICIARPLDSAAAIMPAAAVGGAAVLLISGAGRWIAGGWICAAIALMGACHLAIGALDPVEDQRRFWWTTPLLDLAIGGTAAWWLLIR